jgi:membrane-associated HD superfamily phosphohydrolase
MPEPLTVTLVSATVVTVAVCVYKSIDRVISAPKELVRQSGATAEDLIRTFASELKKLFGSEPRISVNRRIVQTGGQAIRELALYKETVLIKEEWEDTSWKSTKKLCVEQPFTLKAGFDLNRLKFELDPASKQVTATISESTIINVEYAGDYEILKEEHGFWNRISPVERDAIVNSLPEKARQEVEELQLRDKAAEQLKNVLQKMLPPDVALVIKCTDDTLCFEQKSLAPIPPTTLSRLGLSESQSPKI